MMQQAPPYHHHHANNITPPPGSYYPRPPPLAAATGASSFGFRAPILHSPRNDWDVQQPTQQQQQQQQQQQHYAFPPSPATWTAASPTAPPDFPRPLPAIGKNGNDTTTTPSSSTLNIHTSSSSSSRHDAPSQFIHRRNEPSAAAATATTPAALPKAPHASRQRRVAGPSFSCREHFPGKLHALLELASSSSSSQSQSQSNDNDNNEPSCSDDSLPRASPSGVAEGHHIFDSVAWLPHGRSFKILDEARFMKHVVPVFFRQTKIRSFHRQLYLWGYRKVVKGKDAGAWHHKHFLRDAPREMANMKRIKVKGVYSKSGLTASSAVSSSAVSTKAAASSKSQPSEAASSSSTKGVASPKSKAGTEDAVEVVRVAQSEAVQATADVVDLITEEDSVEEVVVIDDACGGTRTTPSSPVIEKPIVTTIGGVTTIVTGIVRLPRRVSSSASSSDDDNSSSFSDRTAGCNGDEQARSSRAPTTKTFARMISNGAREEIISNGAEDGSTATTEVDIWDVFKLEDATLPMMGAADVSDSTTAMASYDDLGLEPLPFKDEVQPSFGEFASYMNNAIEIL